MTALQESTESKLRPVTEPATPAEDIVISVRDVGKMYRIYERPQDRLKQMLLWRLGRHYGREFWALNGVSFEVPRGETLGIVGRNGSGKSTLLQIIAGTLAPTTGSVTVSGRVAALLELGSGFNPEFTGRENVFMNGAILGINRDEMETRFAEIAAFADIGEFIEQPVKLYSSGMLMRLAFAVQAVVQKDVLIVDEALAVGDEAFQRKCFRKLEQFREEGGTVLLVAHSSQTIVAHCDRCLLLWNGELLLDGASKPVTDLYQRLLGSDRDDQSDLLSTLRELPLPERIIGGVRRAREQASRALLAQTKPERGDTAEAFSSSALPQPPEMSYGSKQAEIIAFGMYDTQGRRVTVLTAGALYTWRFTVHFHETAYDVVFGMMLKTVDGLEVGGTNSEREQQRFALIPQGSIVDVSIELRANLAPGVYYLNSGVTGDTDTELSKGGYLHRRVDICAIRVIPAPQSPIYFGIAHIEPQLSVRYLVSAVS